MAIEVVKTVKPSGGHYTSAAAWEAGEQRNLPALNEIAVAECYNFVDNGDGSAVVLSISGWETSASCYIEVRTPPSESHSGLWGANSYRMSQTTGATSNAVQISEDYVRLTGIQIERTATSVGNTSVILVGTALASIFSGHVVLSKCILRQAGNPSFVENGVRVRYASDTAVLDIVNCAVLNGSTAVATSVAGVVTNTTVDPSTRVNIYSTTILGFFRSVLSDVGRANITMKNCYTQKSYSGVTTVVTCSSANFDQNNFLNPPSDYRLTEGSALRHIGTNISGEPWPFNYTTDIAGTSRSGAWDIGCFEYATIARYALPCFKP